MNVHTLKAQLLISQGQYREAEKEARNALGIEPDSALAHRFLAIALSQQNKLEDALNSARESRRLQPDEPQTYFLVGAIHYSLDNLKRARANLEDALRLEPDFVEALGLMGAIALRESQFAQALDYAEAGLRLEPDNPECNNIRSQALIKLGRKEEAGWSVENNLQLNPDSASVHATAGWNTLERGDRKKAEEHFLEALRLDPGNEYARDGLVTVIKARNFVFRGLLNFQFAMSRLSQGQRWGVIIGAYLLYRVLRGVAASNESLQLLVGPIIIIYLLLVLLTWCGNLFFNFLLFAHPLGRHALEKKDKLASIGVAALLLIAVAAYPASLALGLETSYLLSVSFLLLLIPYSAAAQAHYRSHKRILWPAFAVLALMVFSGAALILLGNEKGYALSTLGMLGSGLSSWISNMILMRER